MGEIQGNTFRSHCKLNIELRYFIFTAKLNQAQTYIQIEIIFRIIQLMLEEIGRKPPCVT